MKPSFHLRQDAINEPNKSLIARPKIEPNHFRIESSEKKLEKVYRNFQTFSLHCEIHHQWKLPSCPLISREGSLEECCCWFSYAATFSSYHTKGQRYHDLPKKATFYSDHHHLELIPVLKECSKMSSTYFEWFIFDPDKRSQNAFETFTF